MPVQPWTGKKVIVAGILLEPNELLDIFNEFGLAIVDDDLAQESRQIRVDVLDGEERVLCTEWLKHGSRCMVAPLQQTPKKVVAKC